MQLSFTPFASFSSIFLHGGEIFEVLKHTSAILCIFVHLVAIELSLVSIVHLGSAGVVPLTPTCVIIGFLTGYHCISVTVSLD